MEEKKSARPARRWNVIDILVVILVLAAVALVAWKMMGRGGGGQADLVHVTYTVKAEEVDASLYDSVQAHLPSQLMASGVLYNGQIEAVRQEPFLVLSAEGEWVEDPAHVNLYFTVTLNVPDAAVQTTKVGDQEVRVGKTDYILKSEFIEFSEVVITDVIWEK